MVKLYQFKEGPKGKNITSLLSHDLLQVTTNYN
jgi:hypothetical protein